MSGLHTELVGSGRPSFAFLHGLLGRGRNWSQIAIALSRAERASVLFDLPNHGESRWTDDFSYLGMAEAVAEEVDERMGSAARMVLVGHSMGGKVAMLTALSRPELVSGLVVVDIAPGPSNQAGDFASLLNVMRSINLSTLTSRADAEQRLRAEVPEEAVRGLLLQNLRRKGGWHWQPNLQLLSDSLTEIGGWPDNVAGAYPGPVLWLTGERSEYCRDQQESEMLKVFPGANRLVVPGAGHWVHADAPEVVVWALLDFAERNQLS